MPEATPFLTGSGALKEKAGMQQTTEYLARNQPFRASISLRGIWRVRGEGSEEERQSIIIIVQKHPKARPANRRGSKVKAANTAITLSPLQKVTQPF